MLCIRVLVMEAEILFDLYMLFKQLRECWRCSFLLLAPTNATIENLTQPAMKEAITDEKQKILECKENACLTLS